MSIVQYILPYDYDNRKRHFHETQKGAMIRFVVQYETKVEGRWQQVIRYDGAHGFAHKDIYNRRGEKLFQIPLLLDFGQSLTLADKDINDNWETYLERFLRS